MRQKSIINYFFNGFYLANRSLDLYLISVLLSLATFIRSQVQNSYLSSVVELLDFVLVFIGISFTLSLPAFLVQKQKSEALDYGEVVKVTLKNTKKLILPGLLLFIFFVLLLLSFVLVAILLHPSRDQVTMFFQNHSKGWQPIFLIPIVFISFLEFTSFFFSLEHNCLLISLKKSIVAAFNNLHYMSIIILISIISYTLASFIPIETIWGQLFRTLLGGYISLLLTASSLFYYQAVIKRSL